MKVGPRETIVFALLLAFLAGAYLLGFRRLAQQRAFYVTDLDRKRTTLTALAQHSASIAQLETQLGELHGAIDLFERKLPRQREVDRILNDVWELGKHNDLRPRSVRPLKSEQAGTCTEQPIELTFDGEFPGFLAFLRDLEASDRIVRVTQIELAKSSARTSSPKDERPPMTAKLTLNIYFEPETVAAAAN